MYSYFMRTSFREKNDFITPNIQTRAFNVITILLFNNIDFVYTITTNFEIQQKPTTIYIQSINKLCKHSKKSKSNKKSTKIFKKSLSQTSMVLKEAMNHSLKQLSVTENLKKNHQQLNQYQQEQFHYHHYHHCHYQLKDRLSTESSLSVVTSLVNFQQVLSARSLTKGMLVSSTTFTAVDGIKSITYNDMKEQQQQQHNHHHHYHQQQINSATINAMITSSATSTTNTTTITTLTSSIATMMSKSYQNVSDFFDMNFTPSVSEVLLAPTISTVIPTTTASSSSSVIAVAAGAASAEDESSTGIIITTMNSSDSSGTTDANNGTDDGLNSFYFYETEQFAVLWILFIVIVLGNSAVLVTLFLNKNRKSRMNFFIKQLAVADLLVGLLNVLTDIIWRITVSWRAGNIACKLIRFLQVCVTYASTYVLVALSIDRYDAITHPMNFSGSWQRARRLVGCAWVVSAIFSAPMLFLYEEKLIQGQTQCWIELGKPWRWQLYMSLVSATLFFFPALIITACYAIIVRTIWVKGAVFIPAERGRGCGNHASRRASSRGIIPRAKIKTVKMTFVIVIVFVLCWSPYIVFDLLQVFGQIPRTQTNIAIATFIQSLAPLNSAANPLIYCLFSTQVCRALRRIPPFRWIPWSCCCYCCYCCGYCKSQGRNSAPIHCTTVGQRLHNSCDSMRTLTTSLTMSRRSNNNCMRPSRVVIVERPKTILAMSEV